MKVDNSFAGSEFGRLKALGPAFSVPCSGRRRVFVVTQCECGTVSAIRVDGLRNSTYSCGCAQRDSAVALGRRRSGQDATNFKHGGHGTPLYGVWRGMLGRCENRNATGYHNYGGRRILVCEQWHDFAVFLAWAKANGYDPRRLELDRRNNDEGYSPDNCRWVTTRENTRNTRAVVKVTAFGETKCVTEWSEDHRAAASLWTIRKRLNAGWNPERAITAPTRS